MGITSLDPAATVACDSDGDGQPDPFDLDDDDDGVPDQIDISPTNSIGRDGNAYDPDAPLSFDYDHPLSLNLQNLTPGEPALVDIQLRPENPKHLTYAMNVLDWPAHDFEGQIQHVKASVFVGQRLGETTVQDLSLIHI